MSDLLNRPWIVGSASKALLGETSSPELPKIVQILEYHQASFDGSVAVLISDKFNYCPAIISPQGVTSLSVSLGERSLALDLAGALIKVEAAVWEVASENGVDPSLRLVIERLLYVGGGGDCGVHGNPRSLFTSEAIREALAQGMLSADELMALDGETTSLSLSLDSEDAPDWLVDDGIPVSQQAALEHIPFWEVLPGRVRGGENLDYFDSLKRSTRWPVEYTSW